MMRHLTIMTVAAVTVTTLSVSEAWAQRGGRGWGGRGGGWMRHVKSLNLSSSQIQKIGQLRTEMVSKVAPLRAQIDVKRAELRTLWQTSSPNRRSIVAKHNEIDAIHRQIRNHRIDFKIGVIGALTPAQRGELQKAIAAGPPYGRGPHRGKGRGRGGPGCPGGGCGWRGGR